MKDSFVVTFPSHPKFLSVTRALTEKIGKLYEFEVTTIEEMKLAVDEACANVIKHAYYGDTTQKIILKYKVSRNSFKVIIEDTGVKARASLIKGRNLDDIRPGGLGVHFIKKVFDVFEFDDKKKKGNRLTLIKYMRINI